MSKAVKAIEEKLASMKGKTFDYAKQLHYVEDYSIEEGEQKFTIKTNLRTYTRYFDSFEEFTKYWTEVHQVNALVPVDSADAGVRILEKEDALTDKLIDTLMNNIEKVQKDAAYIPQATAVNNNVNSVTNLIKLKLAFAREVKRRR